MAYGHWGLLRDASCEAHAAAIMLSLNVSDQLSEERIILSEVL